MKEELLRQNKTLTGIARDAGMYPAACRQGIIGASRPGAEAIATALGVPFREMFPDMFTRGRHDGSDTSSKKNGSGRAKRPPLADDAQTAA
ncbi:transcriptional regulator [Ochrobactrum haematophilum]|uniref:Transcriptional regulator n=1 Tax=Brucella haematophila TaxID=419474 RepID=A0ABX1DMR2_9HYPH|nr:transcriptional regulator [Brucella haematophila]